MPGWFERIVGECVTVLVYDVLKFGILTELMNNVLNRLFLRQVNKLVRYRMSFICLDFVTFFEGFIWHVSVMVRIIFLQWRPYSSTDCYAIL